MFWFLPLKAIKGSRGWKLGGNIRNLQLHYMGRGSSCTIITRVNPTCITINLHIYFKSILFRPTDLVRFLFILLMKALQNYNSTSNKIITKKCHVRK
jgi:hypothetical protein